MDFLALSRRELQALCKRNSVRANMSNAAMADALRALPSVDGFEEIGTTVPPPVSAIKSVEQVVIEEEKKDGIPLSRGGRARSRARTAAADKMEQDAPDQGALQGSQGTGAREPGAPVDWEEVIWKEQGHGCPLPRGGRARAKTKKAAAHKKEAVVAPETLQLQGSQRTAAGEGMVPVEAEEVATGKRRTRRSGRSKVKMASDEKEEVPLAARMEQKVSDKCRNDPKEQEVVMVVEEEATKPEEIQNVTRRTAAHEAEEEVLAPAFLRRTQRTVAPEGMASVEVEEVGTGKRRPRRSARSKVALDQKEAEDVAVWKDAKADSSHVAIGSAVVSDRSCNDPKTQEVVVVVQEDVTKGQNVTRRPAVHEMEEVPAPAILRRSQRTVAPVEEEEVATSKKRTRSTRSKVVAAARKGQKANSSDTIIGSADKSSIGPNEDEVIAIVEEETTKPHDGGNVIRKAMAHKMEEVPLLATLQQSQRTVALEATAPVEAEEGATTKRRRRPIRSKVAAAAQNGQKTDSSDAAIGSPDLVSDRSCGDFREDQLVAVVEEHVAKPQEGIDEQEQSRTIHKSACSGKMEDPPTVSVLLSKPEAIDVHDKKTIKEDCFTLTSVVDQSDLLVNTLERFSKPMYEFTVKGEKKDGECWWMLM